MQISTEGGYARWPTIAELVAGTRAYTYAWVSKEEVLEMFQRVGADVPIEVILYNIVKLRFFSVRGAKEDNWY